MPTSPKFAVIFLPHIIRRKFTPVELTTALARLGYGKLVRADYAACGVFAYLAYVGWRIPEILAMPKGLRVSARAAHGRSVNLHVLPADGWGAEGPLDGPTVLTSDVVSYDIDSPDAGEGSWANWQTKVSAIVISTAADGFYDPMPNATVEMLRERRWEAATAAPAAAH